MSAGKAFWTSGVRDPNVANKWKWSSGEEWTYSNWRQKEPSNTLNREKCLMINWDYTGSEVNGLFNDLRCDFEIGFICQKGNSVKNKPKMAYSRNLDNHGLIISVLQVP